MEGLPQTLSSPGSAEKKTARRRVRVRRPPSSKLSANVNTKRGGGEAENGPENREAGDSVPALKVRPPREHDPREPIPAGEPSSTPRLDTSKQLISAHRELLIAPPCNECRKAPRTVTYLCCKSLLRCISCHVKAQSTVCSRCGLDYCYMGGFISARYF